MDQEAKVGNTYQGERELYFSRLHLFPSSTHLLIHAAPSARSLCAWATRPPKEIRHLRYYHRHPLLPLRSHLSLVSSLFHLYKAPYSYEIICIAVRTAQSVVRVAGNLFKVECTRLFTILLGSRPVGLIRGHFTPSYPGQSCRIHVITLSNVPVSCNLSLVSNAMHLVEPR